MTTTTLLDPALAAREIERRTKSGKARKQFVGPEYTDASGEALRLAVAQATVQPARKAKSTPKAKADAKADDIKARAKAAFDLAHAEAEPGSKIRAAKAAYGRVMRGEV